MKLVDPGKFSNAFYEGSASQSFFPFFWGPMVLDSWDVYLISSRLWSKSSFSQWTIEAFVLFFNRLSPIYKTFTHGVYKRWREWKSALFIRKTIFIVGFKNFWIKGFLSCSSGHQVMPLGLVAGIPSTSAITLRPMGRFLDLGGPEDIGLLGAPAVLPCSAEN